MAVGLTEAILRRPPRGAASAQDGQNHVTTVVAASTTALVLPTLAPTSGGCWVTFVSTSDCFIRFGYTAGTTPVGSATTSDYFMAAGVEEEFWISFPDDASFSVIRSTADGNLYRFRSSR